MKNLNIFNCRALLFFSSWAWSVLGHILMSPLHRGEGQSSIDEKRSAIIRLAGIPIKIF